MRKIILIFLISTFILFLGIYFGYEEVNREYQINDSQLIELSQPLDIVNIKL